MKTSSARGQGFAAGVAAAFVLLLAAGTLRAASGATSVLEVFADGILLLLPGALFSSLLDVLQRSAKPLLYASIAVGAIVVGGLVGRWYGERPGWRRAVVLALGLWLSVGLGAYTLFGAGPFGSNLAAGPLWHGGTLLALVGTYALALDRTFRALAGWQAKADMPGRPSRTRRRLFQAGVLAAGLAAFGGTWRLLIQPASQGDATSGAPLPPPANPPPFDQPGLAAEVTPTASFYTVSKNLADPSVDAAGWRLTVDGLVDRPLAFSYQELRGLPPSEGYYTLMCISNEVGGDLVGNALWRGVKLRWLLEQAGVQAAAKKAVFVAADGYRDSVPVDRALHPDALLAWEMNGAPLPGVHGFPARLLIPGIYGMKNVKWLTGINLVSEDFKGYWQVRGWDDEAFYRTTSRIDVPRPRATLTHEQVVAAGIAFAGDRGITRVEVSPDGGETWLPAELKAPMSPYAWRLWRAALSLPPGAHVLQVRATDGAGHLQIRSVAPPFPAGATGYHTVTVATS